MNNNKKVGLLYDPIMLRHVPFEGHPERPERLKAVVDLLMRSSIWPHIVNLPVRAATMEELQRVHTPRYVETVRRVIEAGARYLDDGDTAASEGTWEAALNAAGAAIGAVDYAMLGDGNMAFALVRPPGHHALPTTAMGFCVFNNIAIAAEYARIRYGLERILIVDIDVHHGNGTQDIFYESGNVLFVSLHQPAYPFTGAVNEKGIGDGLGTTINVSMPIGSRGHHFIEVFQQIVVPAARRYKPEIVLVSAGYDAHWRNAQYVQRIGLCLTTSDYYAIGKVLKQIADEHCGGKIAAVLEGGYDLDSLAHGVEQTLCAWLEVPSPPDPVGLPPRNMLREIDIQAIISDSRTVHKL